MNLVVIATPTPSQLGKRYEVVGECTIGRSHASIVIDGDEGMSRVHCHLEPTEAGWVIRDMASTHGVRVDDVWIDGPHELRDGATVTLGQTMFKFLDREWPPPRSEYLISPRKLDGLTQTLTKAFFCNHKPIGAEGPAVAIGFDIRGLGIINDTYGVRAGDHAISHVGQSLLKLVGDSGSVVRTGGDDFVVVLPNDSLEVAEDLAWTALSAVRAKPCRLPDGDTVDVDLWVGIVLCDGHSPNELLDAADQAAADYQESPGRFEAH